jgi:phosphatidylserine/phosphatidylglycerophosphate/cardiolipin synthase-like enzyme
VIEFITDKEIYSKVIQAEAPGALKYLWIATADIKDLHVNKGKKMVPFLEVLSDLIGRGVSVRLLHAGEAGRNFRNDFDRYPNLIEGLERLQCPRVHFKAVVVDGRFAYTGSANLTGAGMGAKNENRRNFESGIITDEKSLVNKIMAQFDEIWMGNRCAPCRRKEFCSDYPDILAGRQ